ncbi:MAG TPA: DNA-binding response regulator [Rhodospirillaceae bacterium]|jgi:two-component system cell cycle response regulator CtrA|nr:response regulator transcription factor [Alphaproteobacteria bacterium]HBH27033.1 DNA-binding response regulator [Rhodospirillaceae bacterium]
MRILLIEDDRTLAKSVRLMLSSEKYVVDLAPTGEEGLEIARSGLYDYDIIILDLILPDMSGHDITRALRDASVKTPILILSGLASADEKIKGLSHGADDYLTKPFDKRELVARLQAIVRRAQGHAQSAITVGRLTVNVGAKTAEVDGTPISLTGKEYAVLELLAMRKGITLTKESFLSHLYGGMDEPDAKIVDVFVCKLRRKLKAALDGESYIETVWGQGYVLREPKED